MSDETVVIHKTPPSFAYLFWLAGPRRGEHVMLKPEGMTLGRSNTAEIQLDDVTVSDEHACIKREGRTWYLYDLASSNQVRVGGKLVHRQALADKDRLRIGMTELTFRLVR
jgi:predicted component of type VI protein secretion system